MNIHTKQLRTYHLLGCLVLRASLLWRQYSTVGYIGVFATPFLHIDVIFHLAEYQTIVQKVFLELGSRCCRDLILLRSHDRLGLSSSFPCSYHVGSSPPKTLSYPIRPSQIGVVDIIFGSLPPIQPHGIPQEHLLTPE